jgi:glycosyltransferase involved in cell wall biosynthesis
LKKKYKIGNNIDVIPNICTFPKRDLHELNKIKAEIKKQFNLKNAIILLHIGSFLQWTDVNMTIDIFKKLRKLSSKIFLLIVTYEDKKKVYSILKKSHLLRTQYLVTHVPHEEIHQFIPVGDLGLILRDNSLINQVAFPTKFSEYLACGVPVLCSSSIKGVARDVAKYGLGYVLTNSKLQKDTFLKDLLSGAKQKKRRNNCISHFDQELVKIKDKLERIYIKLT